MEEKVSGIVLSGISYGENDKILNVFTLEKGVISAKIKGVKKAGAKLKFASEPFCFAEFILINGRAGYSVKTASLTDSFYAIREDIERYFCGGAVLEFIRKFYKENIVAPDAFLTTIEGLREIAYSDNPLSALVCFLITSLKEIGYALRTATCFDCGCVIKGRTYFEYERGAFFCEECHTKESREINPETLGALKKVENKVFASREECIRALRLLDYYLSNKAEENIKSLKELLKIAVL